MFLRKPLGLAVAMLACSAVFSHAKTQAAEVDDRIAELERQLAELKSLVVSNKSSIDSNIETLAVQAEDLDEARPMSKGTKFTYGGYVQLDAIASNYSEGKPASVMDDLFVPSLIPVEPQSGSGDSYTNTNIHAKSSRFHFGTATQTDAGKISSFIELDFILSGQGDERVSNSFSSRIRHAYLKWDYGGQQSLLAGQAWSTFFNVGALPDLLDFVGPVGTVFERQPMVRWTSGPWQLAVENQTTRVNLQGGGSQLNDAQLLPDLVARYDGRTGDLKWSVAAIGRQLSYEERPAADIEGISDEQFGYGLSFAGKWNIGRNDLRFMASYGDALGRYMGLNSFNDGYIDHSGQISKIDQWGGFVAYRHYWSDQWRSNLSVSASEASNPSTAEFDGAGNLAKSYRSMHINLNYLPAPKLQLGGELMYGVKELEDGRDGDMYRLQFAAKYAF
ncbi:DcaP family trimeric outer membrane transporter [Congregibacter brevis]|uniref:DcaP family trimeric outer membrane transporter n=1 Tax=Congregibacter brevis TaxID=3081201 RepID=A0ABZ0IAQ5_9GAMM|nr:DcaP family trimeric outer membrane transporter [Congregibacter sp. IMCC45268]